MLNNVILKSAKEQLPALSSKKIALTALVLYCSFFSFAQSRHMSYCPKIIHEGLDYNDIFFSQNGKTGWIVGDFGRILKTTDGGESWLKYDIPDFNLALMSVFFLKDNLTGWVSGNSGTVFKTTDGGRKWEKSEDIPTEKGLWYIHFAEDKMNGVACGADGTLITTKDGGKSWEINDSTNSSAILRGAKLLSSKHQYWAYGDAMTLLFSSDLGKTWKDKFAISPLPTENPNIYSMCFSINNDVIWGCCEYGYLIRSTDGGVNWHIQKIENVEHLYDIWFDSTMTIGWTAGSDGKMFQTTDGGKTWVQKATTTKSISLVRAIAFNGDGERAWACGNGNLIMRTTDRGETWETRGGFESSLHQFAVKDSLIIVPADGGKIFQSSDKLSTVKRISPESFKEDINSVIADEDLFWGVGSKKTVVRFKENGEGWAVVYNETKGELQDLAINPKSKCMFAVGENSTLLISCDHGKNWERRKLDRFNIIFYDIFFLKNGKIGWIVGDKGRIYESQDYGKSWIKKKFNDTLQNLVSVGFSKDQSIGYITASSAKEENHLFKTNDLGKTWLLDERFPYKKSLRRLSFNNASSEIVIVTPSGYLYRTINGGKSWFETKNRYSYRYICTIGYDVKDQLIMVGHSGLVLRAEKPDSLPIISSYKIVQSGSSYRISCIAQDRETPTKDLYVNVSVHGDLVNGTDLKYSSQYSKYDELSSLEWPKSIFKPGKTYHFIISIFDGWNITYLDKKITHGDAFSKKLIKFLHWSEIPKTAQDVLNVVSLNLMILILLYFILIIILFLVSPIHFVLWHEAVANSKIPLAGKFSHYWVLLLIEHPRSLDAFVKKFRDKAVSLFNSNLDVQSRSVWEPAPFVIDRVPIMTFNQNKYEDLYVPGLSEIKKSLHSDRCIVSIEGQGGVGKSSLAFQIARWGGSADIRRRLFKHQILPIFTNKLDEDLDTLCIKKLNYIVSDSEISNALSNALLKKRRVMVVVDGISEMPDFKDDYIDPESGARKTRVAVYTSRKIISLPEMTTIIPLGLQLSFLDNLLDGFTNSYVGAFKFGNDREVLREKVKDIIIEINSGNIESPVPLSILKFIILQASELLDTKRGLQDFLPNSVTDLFENYIIDLYRKEEGIEDIVKNLRKAAAISLGLFQIYNTRLAEKFIHSTVNIVRPQWLPKSLFKTYLDEDTLDKLLLGGVLISSGTVDDLQLKFTHDPIAEYFAAKELLIQFRDGNLSYDHADNIAEISLEVNPTFCNLLQTIASKMGISFPQCGLKPFVT
jgi:photosystem II stability/assembly factor-like uncharacterized protein